MTTDAISLDSKHTALLVMDLQQTIIDRFPGDKELLPRTANLIATARKAAMKVIYVVVGFRAGYPEISPRNQSFSAIRGTGMMVQGSAGSEIHASVAPQGEEVVVTKHRVGSFSSTDMDMVLRANSIDTLILAGISTSGVVLSTVRHAADADFRIFVVRDCCADNDDEVHRVLLENVFPRQATVTTSDVIMRAMIPS
jgi:nicotinamidase-related amidase